MAEARRALSMRVSGFDPPKPVHSFMHLGFDGNMLVAIKKAGYARSRQLWSGGPELLLCRLSETHCQHLACLQWLHRTSLTVEVLQCCKVVRQQTA